MNDRLKFRVWKKKEKTYLLKQTFLIRGVSFFMFGRPDGEGCSQLEYCIDHPEYFVVEQCTGLKDKNGKLIYEGDIISLFSGTQEAVVEWCAERLGYFVEVQLSAESDFSPECLGNLRDTIEVIGNIHENPELLEDKK